MWKFIHQMFQFPKAWWPWIFSSPYDGCRSPDSRATNQFNAIQKSWERPDYCPKWNGTTYHPAKPTLNLYLPSNVNPKHPRLDHASVPFMTEMKSKHNRSQMCNAPCSIVLNAPNPSEYNNWTLKASKFWLEVRNTLQYI